MAAAQYAHQVKIKGYSTWSSAAQLTSTTCLTNIPTSKQRSNGTFFQNDNEISHLNSRANDYKNDEGLQIIRATNRGWYRPWQTGGKMALRLKVERIYRADINWVVETSFVLRFQSHNKSADQPMSFSANVWSPLFKPPYRAAKPIIRRSQDFLFLPPNLSSFQCSSHYPTHAIKWKSHF
jgi:hypothetical protein